jgi:hypothetical protein
MRIHKIKFNDEQIAPWTYEGSDSSVYTLASAIALSGLEGKYIRLSAALQRRLLGFPVFGKQEFMFKADGTFYTYCKVCFGSDWETTGGPQSYVGIAAKRHQKISPRFSGKGYFSKYHYEKELQ